MNTPTPQSAQWMADAAKHVNLIHSNGAWSRTKHPDKVIEEVIEAHYRQSHHGTAKDHTSDLSTRVRALEHALRELATQAERMTETATKWCGDGPTESYKAWGAINEARALLSPGRLAG